MSMCQAVAQHGIEGRRPTSISQQAPHRGRWPASRGAPPRLRLWADIRAPVSVGTKPDHWFRIKTPRKSAPLPPPNPHCLKQHPLRHPPVSSSRCTRLRSSTWQEEPLMVMMPVGCRGREGGTEGKGQQVTKEGRPGWGTAGAQQSSALFCGRFHPSPC